MKTTDIISNSNLLVEEHFKKTNKLVEHICNDLTKEQKIIVEAIYKTCHPLIEASLTPDQIQQIFTDVETGATQAGGNRTLIGKGKDAVTAANDIVNKVGAWLQNTTPVQNFDNKFETLKTTVANKFPNLAKNVEALGNWAKQNPGKTAAVVGVMTALASLAAGPAGGAIAGQVLQGTVSLLKGEKLSTAIGKGVKTGVLGYLSGKAFEVLGDWLAGFRERAIPVGPKDAGLEQVSWGATQKLTAPGFSHTETLQGFDVIVFRHNKEEIEQAMAAISNGQPGGFAQLREIADSIRTPEYRSAIQRMLSDAKAEKLANDGLLKWINGVAQAGQAISQGAVAAGGAGSAQATNKTESTKLTVAQINKIFEHCGKKKITEGPLDKISGALSQFGKNLTTKVTADKLNQAWVRAGKPTDSSDIIKILHDSGVSDSVLTPIFKELNIDIASPTAQPTEPASSPTSTTNPTPAQPSYDELMAMVPKMSVADAKQLSVYIDGLEATGATSAGSTTSAAGAASADLFKNPQNLAAAWDAYKEAGGKFTPALRQTIKDIWMNMGGIKAESKNYKK